MVAQLEEDTGMQTLKEFVARCCLTMTCVPTDHNPGMPEERYDMDHWRCTLRGFGNPRRRMSVVFSMGRGHNGREPELTDVLDCLASDAGGYEDARNFEEWASDLGYDPDSRAAERTFRAVKRQSDRLRHFLGDAYEQLLYETERG